MVFYVGAYTDMSWSKGRKGEGIYRVRFDPGAGRMECLSVTGGLTNPSYLVLNQGQERLYAVGEVEPSTPSDTGLVSTFAVGGEGELELLGATSAFGLSPCYLALDPKEGHGLLTNYISGSVVSLAMDGNGVLRECVQLVQHSGSGPNPQRQEAPRAHSLQFDRDGRHLIVADLGIDKLMVYGVAYDGNRPVLSYQSCMSTEPGTGPRHMAWGSEGRRLYLLCEMGSRVYVFDYDGKTGGLTQRQNISTLPEGTAAENNSAQILLSKDGRFLYCSNRGHDSIAVFHVDPNNGELEFIAAVPSGGSTPRNFALDPTGQFLLAANQDSDNITAFSINRETGLLNKVSELSIPAPVFLLFRG